MSDPRTVLNEYLFYEFGYEEEQTRISVSWPFELKLVGMIDGIDVYEFVDDEPYYAFDHGALSFLAQVEIRSHRSNLLVAGYTFLGVTALGMTVGFSYAAEERRADALFRGAFTDLITGSVAGFTGAVGLALIIAGYSLPEVSRQPSPPAFLEEPDERGFGYPPLR